MSTSKEYLYLQKSFVCLFDLSTEGLQSQFSNIICVICSFTVYKIFMKQWMEDFRLSLNIIVRLILCNLTMYWKTWPKCLSLLSWDPKKVYVSILFNRNSLKCRGCNIVILPCWFVFSYHLVSFNCSVLVNLFCSIFHQQMQSSLCIGKALN